MGNVALLAKMAAMLFDRVGAEQASRESQFQPLRSMLLPSLVTQGVTPIRHLSRRYLSAWLPHKSRR
jgi:hypothetical protein